jgi:hypothetical protein
MDQLVSQILPTQRIGNDGFQWWVGQIEGTASDEQNNKGGYRFKVRIVGDHPGDPELVGTDDLPWANVMMPVTVPFIPGNKGGAHPQLEIGCWVVGFYMDTEKQKPIIMGSIGQTPGATKVFVERTPNTPPFVTAIPQIKAPKEGSPKQKGTEKNTATGGLTDGTKDGDGNDRVAPTEELAAPLKNETQQSENWCQSKAEKCDQDDMTSQLSGIMGEFLASVQNNGGNIGTDLVNKATGGLMDGVNIARGYVNKAMSVVTEFVARVKGFVIEKLTAAVKDLIKALLYPSEDGNALTPVTEFFNNLLKQLGCSMADLGDRLAEFLTDLLMSYVEQIYRSVACQIDALVNGIISKINSLMEELLNSVLGPLNDILGAIAAPLNIIGGAINFVLNLLGISCSGPDRSCSKTKQICTNGAEKLDEEGDFLDDLLNGIDNLFPSTGADYNQYICGEAFTGKPLDFTVVGFTGGIPITGGSTGNIPESEIGSGSETGDNNNGVKQNKIITYNISDITVEEGDIAEFVVTRSGYTEISSSLKYKTLKYRGSARENQDYLPANDILGFAPGETRKSIFIRTVTSSEREGPEDFYLILKKNTPLVGSKAKSVFQKNVAICTITEADLRDSTNPWRGPTKNPFDDLGEVFTDNVTTVDIVTDPDQRDTQSDIQVDSNNDGLDDTTGNDIIQSVSVVADRDTCPEGEFITYTITTTNIENGTTLFYTLSGNDITPEDIVGGSTTGSFVINSDSAKVVIGIEDDGVVEDAEVLRFNINGRSAFADVIITTSDNDDDFDEGVGDGTEISFNDFTSPSVNTNNIVTDENGGIIYIPVDNPGDPWAEPPYVFITGQGIGATASALLDEKGYLTEIRINSSGYGYKKNLPQTTGKRCIIDTFTVVRPGVQYSEKPTIYVNGRTDVAEATINEDGFVIGARVLDRITTYDKFPEIIIVGGGGYGAKLLPSLVCLDEQNLATIGSTKIGTGRYVDCP